MASPSNSTGSPSNNAGSPPLSDSAGEQGGGVACRQPCLLSQQLHHCRFQPMGHCSRSRYLKEEQVKYLFGKAQSTFGPRIHILVAAAGVQDPTYPLLAETTLEQWEWVYNINAKGTFLCCREAANRLVRGGGGRIITMSSSMVGSLRPGYSTYSSTKGAIEMMTKILAKEQRGTGITVNAVAPGPIATPLFYAGKSEERIRAVAAESPMARLGRPEDVAPMVGFLASDAGEWINGQIIRLNGGYV